MTHETQLGSALNGAMSEDTSRAGPFKAASKLWTTSTEVSDEAQEIAIAADKPSSQPGAHDAKAQTRLARASIRLIEEVR